MSFSEQTIPHASKRQGLPWYRRPGSWGRWYLIAYTLLAGLLGYLAFSHWGYDDPFITYRYAHNLAHGLGFVYNPGEPVLSTTTPLFTLILAGLSVVWPGDDLQLIPRLALVLGAVSLPLGGLCLWDLGKQWKSGAVGWVGLLLYPAFPLVVSTISSETPLYLAFCLATFASYQRRNYSLTALCAALAALTRPDGLLLVVPLAFDHFLRRRPIHWKAVGIYLVLILAWSTFAWGYFGSPLPVTLAAKHNQGNLAVSVRFAAGIFYILQQYTAWPYLLAGMLSLVGGLGALIRAVTMSTEGHDAPGSLEPLLILWWGLLYFTAYAAMGVTRYFWYYAPLVPPFLIALGLGLDQISSLLQRLTFRLNWSLRHRFLAVLPSFAIITLLLVTQANDLWQVRKTPDPRLELFRPAGQWLAQNTPPGASVGALEVGIIGYYAQRPMIDFAGLIQPDIAAQLTTTYEDAAVWAVNQYQPGYLALFSGMAPRLEQGYTAQSCQVLTTFPGTPYHVPYNIVIYQCTDH